METSQRWRTVESMELAADFQLALNGVSRKENRAELPRVTWPWRVGGATKYAVAFAVELRFVWKRGFGADG